MKNIYVNDESFLYYFQWIQERMKIFWKRYNNEKAPWTNDPVFQKYKFTNVYRCLDRVSQYLIKNVIYNPECNVNEEDIVFRILLFKLFNKIETWEYLIQELGYVSLRNFNLKKYSDILTERIKVEPIYSNAYMMTGSSKYVLLPYKHQRHLLIMKNEIINGGKIRGILEAKKLEEIFNIISGVTFMGSFLAYQYAIDLNYSPVVNFSENSFVKAGPGAIRGIQKCFNPPYPKHLEDILYFVQEMFSYFQLQYGYAEFTSLFGRPLQIIDIQNCFCETDKYLREKRPEVKAGKEFRIKNKFSPISTKIDYCFPPKWQLKV